jgi:hypothetical protein
MLDAALDRRNTGNIERDIEVVIRPEGGNNL